MFSSMATIRKSAKRPAAKLKLLNAALRVIREKGYSATTVDDLCAAAGVTKGAFFHHFPSKQDLAVAAAAHWAEMTDAFFAAAPYHHLEDPLDRVLAYVDFRKSILRGAVPEFTCLVGTMVQETYDAYPAIRNACNASITGHAASLVADIEAAAAQHGVRLPVRAESLALHTQTVVQGAFVLAKAGNDVTIAADSLDHLRRYIKLLFQREET
jgi:TetR/AcrR family transcriptional regulator, transcriptional repressor for nem operon